MNDGSGRGGGRSDVLRRLVKAREFSNPVSALPSIPPPNPLRAATTAIGRAASDLYQLAVQAESVRTDTVTLSELPELLPEQALFVMIQGPGDRLGVMALCRQAVVALTEIQALGRITTREVEPRKLNRSDALICADFVHALLSELERELARVEDQDGVQGFRYASWLDDPRPMVLMLDDRAYRSFDFRLHFGDAPTRAAHILLAFPRMEQAAPEAVRANVAATGAPAAVHGNANSAQLAQAMQSAPIEVVGVLCRRRLTLADLRELVPGRILPLPRVNLAEARVETRDGQLLATGRFGEADGCHAIRLHDPAKSDRTACPDAQRLPDEDVVHAAIVRMPDPADPPPVDLELPDAFRSYGLADREAREIGADSDMNVISGA